MNHGLCKNCWWYKVTKGEGYKFVGNHLVRHSGEGICYMQTINPCSGIEERYITNGDSYCPDYCNREKTNKTDKLTLEEWLLKIGR